MVHQFDKDGKPQEGSVWERETVTDANGYFEISSYAAPYDHVPVGLEVSKAGYKIAYATYIDYLDADNDKSEKTQIFFVALSPSVSNNGMQPAANHSESFAIKIGSVKSAIRIRTP